MVDFVFETATGLRENNEDSYGNFKDEFFVVADGIGGYAAGEVASKLAVETVISGFSKTRNLEKAFDSANKSVLEKSRKNPQYAGMGTTMVAAALHSDKVVVANVGDSRGYLFSEDNLGLITKDDRDMMGFLTGYLGIDGRILVHKNEVSIKKGDTILFCTDGLTDSVAESVIAEILASDVDLKNKAKGLIEAALQFGSTDNITVCLVKTS